MTELQTKYLCRYCEKFLRDYLMIEYLNDAQRVDHWLKCFNYVTVAQYADIYEQKTAGILELDDPLDAFLNIEIPDCFHCRYRIDHQEYTDEEILEAYQKGEIEKEVFDEYIKSH